jgi:hypothetical protein
MPHIFISYQRKNWEFASVLENKLRDAGFDVWMDPDSHAGSDWREEIDTAIDNALALCLIMTPDTVESSYITYEWARALGAKLPVIPILLERTAYWHPRLDRAQVFDFSRAHPGDDQKVLGAGDRHRET